LARQDRRKRRSRETLEAIHLQLEAVKERLGAASVWVADEDGLLLGAADGPLDSEALAAYTPLPGRLESYPDEQMGVIAQMHELDGYQVVLREFDIEGIPFIVGLAFEQAGDDEVSGEVDVAISGIVRILAEGTRE